MKNDNHIRQAPYPRNTIACDHDFWYTCVKRLYLHAFFSFFQNFGFWAVSGVKYQKMAQYDKKFCLSRSISHEPYIIWLLLMVNLVISPSVALLISKVWFFGLLEGWEDEKWPKMTKISVRRAFIPQEYYIIWYPFLVHMCKRIISPGLFLHFSKF